jgi:hypothetical protein
MARTAPGGRWGSIGPGRAIGPIAATWIFVVASLWLGGAAGSVAAQDPSVVPGGPSLSPASGAGPGASIGAPEAEVLFEMTIPTEELPSGEAVAGFGRFEFAPGASVASPPGSSPPSVSIETVLAGRYGVTVDGRLLVLRGGDRTAPTPSPALASPGQEVELAPGDTIVFLDNDESNQLARNLGDTPVVGLAAGIFSTDSPSADISVTGDHRFEFLAFDPPRDWAALAPGGVTMSLARAASLPAVPPPAGVVRLEATVDGRGGPEWGDGDWILTIASDLPTPPPAG